MTGIDKMAVAYLDVTAFIRSSADRHLPRPTGGLEWRSIMYNSCVTSLPHVPPAQKKRKKCLPDRSSLLLIDMYIIHSGGFIFIYSCETAAGPSLFFLSILIDIKPTHMHTLTD